MGLLARLKNSFRKNSMNDDAADELAWHFEREFRNTFAMA
jgi:hypothetical protein